MIEVLTTTAATIDFNQIWESIDWTRPSWDIFILMFFVVGGLLYGLSLGRERLVGMMVSVYMALAIVNYAPFVNQVFETQFNLGGQVFNVKMVAFFGLLLLLLFLLSRSAIMRSFRSGGDSPLWQSVIFSVLHVGLILSVVLSFLPEDGISQLSPFIRNTFTGANQQFSWIIAPVIAMLIFGKRKKKRRYYEDEE